MITTKISSECKLFDEFGGKASVLGNSNSKVYGYVEGFIFTTAYIPSEGISLGKKHVIDLWKQLKTNTRLWRFYENHRDDLPPIGYPQSSII